MTIQWPAVTARLVALLPTLDGWDTVTIFTDPAGENVPVDPVTQISTFATLGYNDPDEDAGLVGEQGGLTTEQSPDGYQYIERGTVPGSITSAVGDTDAYADLQGVVFGALNGIDAAIRADRTLGVLSQEGFFTLTVTSAPALSAGASVTARFALTYYTVT